ncbi:hypothetical protein GCM10022245_11920 [Streptomyces mayteni]
MRVGVGIFVLAACVVVTDDVLGHHYVRAVAVAALTVGLLAVSRGVLRPAG